jgi:uncharacterized protein YbaP (TraB family)
MTKHIQSLFSFFSLIILVQFTACKSAKDTTEIAVQAPSVAKAEMQKESWDNLPNNLLWKISGKELTEPSYLYGTIHMIGAEDFFLPAGTETAVDDSDRLVFEIDMADMQDMSKLMGMMDKFYMADDLTIKDLLSAEDYALVESHFEKAGLPIFFFQRMKPMFLTVFTSGDMSLDDLQSGKIKSYEGEFMEMAESGNKKTAGLETIDFQISIFDQIPYEDQANMLMESIKSGSTGSDSFKEIVNVYKEQNLNKMLTMSISDEDGIGEFEDILLNQRNKNWIPQMQTMMTESQNFFAVGAAHLPGKEGVINLLREAGYTVEPFKSKGI